MIFMTRSILCFTLLNILILSQSAPESPVVDGYDIVVTELAIRNIVNNLFSTLKLRDMKQNLKFKQHSTIHNFFVSITLRGHDNLKEIARLTKVDKIDNGTQLFIAQLNEVLDEDNKSDEETDAVYITILIEEFLKRLDNLKEIHGLKNNGSNFGINQDTIKYLNNDESDFENATKFKKGNDSNDDNVLSDSEFWQVTPSSSGRRIFEGRTAKIERYPFMASVQFFKKFQCGGSIIKSDLVITSASCLQLAWNNRFFRENPAFLSVNVGNSHYEFGSENIPVIEIYFHPNYNPKNLQHNLAVMRLQRVLKFSSKVPKIKKIDFDRNPWALPSNTDGITIVGWGAKGASNHLVNPLRNKLSYARLEFYPLKECQEIYSKEFVTNRHFCAGFFSKGGGACNRDAGGPGIASGILVGVISFGSPNCGAPDAPTVFTKLGFYTDWIEEIMEQKVPQQIARTTNRPIYKHTTFPVAHKPHEVEAITPFKVTPIDDNKNKSIVKHIPIKEVDTLRNKKKDKSRVFKEFLATMFNNEEVREYFEQIQAEKKKDYKKTNSKKKLRHKTKVKSKTKTKGKPNKKSKTKKKTKTKSKVTSTTKATAKKYFTVYDAHLKDKVGKIKKDYDSSNEYSKEIVSRSNKQRNIEKSTEEDKKMELVIMNLIDKLDIEDILESEENSPKEISAQHNNKGKVQQKKRTRHQNPVSTESKLNKPGSKCTSDSEEDLYNYYNKNTKNTFKGKTNSEYNKSNEHEKQNKSNSDDTDDSEENETDVNNEGSENNEDENNEDGDNEEDGMNKYNEKECLRDRLLDNEDIDKEETEAGSNEIENNEEGNNEEGNSNDDDDKDVNDEIEATEGEITEETENNEKDYTNEDENASKSDEDEDYETLSIPTEPFKHFKAKHNDTEKLLQLLAESDDVYELLSKAVQGQT